ncbi:MAG: CHAT domain-containing protein, partial [Cyclobacteriaceae bacterium]|nr:CHAT domain-containing protein [Cyclobacteriaceae bacterium]
MKPVLDKVETNAKSIEKIDRIIIVPDGDLSYLPFESLITYAPDTSTVSYWGLPYLCNESTISYAYSLNILKRNLFRPESIIEPKFLGFSYSAPLKSNEDIALLRSENELPYSSEELDRIKNWIKRPTFFKNERATEDVFKSEASNYSLIHLALHGLADTTDMFNSSLKFKINENSIEDGELHAFELYDMDLSQTELAVLSACETGLGKQTEGEGIFSIARGFAYAGCPAIVMSLWKVNDKSTAKLMDYFYEYLANGLQKDKALQKAKLTFIQNSDDLGTHPANWAAFIALGNNQPIQVPKALLQWYHWMLILAFVSGIFFIYLRRKIIAF